MMEKFRLLTAREIDCRVQQIKKNGLTLLLYKDARCDMNILDETVGATNWKRNHSRENKNCTVSIWDEDKKEWVSKEDTGTESNTEAEKGLASDSFKRACVNWGIGRELYTAPFIWVSSDKCEIKEVNGGRFACYDRFMVSEIGYNADREINALVITNAKTGQVVYRMGASQPSTARREPPANTPIKNSNICADCGNVIGDWVKNGVMWKTALAVAQDSEKEFKRPLCINCIRKIQAASK